MVIYVATIDPEPPVCLDPLARDSYETFSLNSPTSREKSFGPSGNGGGNSPETEKREERVSNPRGGECKIVDALSRRDENIELHHPISWTLVAFHEQRKIHRKKDYEFSQTSKVRVENYFT